MSDPLMTTIGGTRYRLEEARARGLVDDSNKPTKAGKELQAAHDARAKRRAAYDSRAASAGGDSNRRPVGSAVDAGTAANSGAIPEGDPSEDWTHEQLDAYAARAGVELAASGTKADKLTALAAAGSGS